MWSMNKDSSFKSGKDRIMKTKSSNNTLYVITAIASVVVILLAAVGFTNVEAQKVERVSADSNFISRAESAAELAASMGVENDVYQARVQNVAGDNDDDLGRMAEALKPIAEYNTDSAALDREVKYLLGGTDTYATTYGGICAAAGEAYRMDLDAATTTQPSGRQSAQSLPLQASPDLLSRSQGSSTADTDFDTILLLYTPH